MNIKSFFSKSLITIISLLILDILSTSFLSKFLPFQMRPFFLGFICIYLLYSRSHVYSPYLILGLCMTHSIFTLEGWAINCFIALLIGVLIQQTREMLNLTTFLSNILFYGFMLMLWDLLRVLIVGVKMGTVVGAFSIIKFDFLSNILMALIAPLFLVVIEKVWAEKKAIEG